MRTEFSEQYGTCCVVVEGTESPDDVIFRCVHAEAIFFDGQDDCYVVAFPGRPQELYTESALRRSLPTPCRDARLLAARSLRLGFSLWVHPGDLWCALINLESREFLPFGTFREVFEYLDSRGTA